MKIGLLGGTFNPIHNAHLILTEYIREECKLDRVIFIPAYLPPHKDSESIPDFQHRLSMAELAVLSNSHFEVSKIESNLTGPSYTINTLRALYSDSKSDQFSLILGSDTFLHLGTWAECDVLADYANFIVIPRAGYPPNDAESRFKNNATIVQAPLIEISSSRIRDYVQVGRSIRYLVPEEVEAYISEHQLYRS